MLDALDTGGVRVSEHEASPAPLGSLLLERGLITDDQLQHALAEHGRTGLPLGQALISLSYVTEATIAQALATQQGGIAKTEFGVSTGFGTPGLLSMPPVSPPAAVSKPSQTAEQAGPRVAEVVRLPAPVVPAGPDPELALARSRIEELERALADARAELATVTQNFTMAYERLQQYELAWGQQQAQQPRTVSPFAWQS